MQFLRFLLFSCALFFSNLHGMAGTREYFGGSTSNNTTIPNIKPSIKPNIKLNQKTTHIKTPTVSSNYNNNGVAILALRAPRSTQISTTKPSDLLANPSMKSFLDEEKKLRNIHHWSKSDDKLKREKAECQTQKKLVEQFEKLKEAATEKVSTELVQPVQWGDSFPMTQSIF